MLTAYCITNADYYARGRENSQNNISNQKKNQAHCYYEKKKKKKAGGDNFGKMLRKI